MKDVLYDFKLIFVLAIDKVKKRKEEERDKKMKQINDFIIDNLAKQENLKEFLRLKDKIIFRCC